MKEVQQAEALRLAEELKISHCCHANEGPSTFSEAAEKLISQNARIAELEAELEAVGAGGVEPLRKGFVRLTDVLARLEQGFGANSAPVTTIKRHFEMQASTAHPAEGVPAHVHSALTDARAVLLSINRGDSHRVKVGDDVCYWQRDEWVQWAINEVLPMVNAAIAATHPTQQGMADLRWQIVHDHIGGEYIAGRACFVVQIPALPGANIMRGSVAEHFTKAVDAIAAQAKQGEQANG